MLQILAFTKLLETDCTVSVLTQLDFLFIFRFLIIFFLLFRFQPGT
jgi:hypothetical protein